MVVFQQEVVQEVEVVETALAEPKKRGRKKKVQAEALVAEVVITEKKKRGRPGKAKVVEESVPEVIAEVIPPEPKKRGRKKVEKPVVEEKPKRGRKPAVKQVSSETETVIVTGKKAVKSKNVKEEKEVKQRKQRVDKEITAEMVQEKLSLYDSSDTNLSMVMGSLFSVKKVARPKFETKLVERIKLITLEDDTVAEQIVNQLKEMSVLDTDQDGRVFYRD